ncbi:MAG: hypothetical protein R3E97_09360 [Candidatus Eisenbacteria bacterium]
MRTTNSTTPVPSLPLWARLCVLVWLWGGVLALRFLVGALEPIPAVGLATFASLCSFVAIGTGRRREPSLEIRGGLTGRQARRIAWRPSVVPSADP